MNGNRLAALVIGLILLAMGLQMLLAAAGLVAVTGPQASLPVLARVAIAAVALPLGLILGGLAWRNHAREARLRSKGMAAAGEVVSVLRNAVHVNRQPRWTLAYRFTDAAGTVHDVHTTLADRRIAESLRPGAPLTVHYDAGNPADSHVTDYSPRSAVHTGS